MTGTLPLVLVDSTLHDVASGLCVLPPKLAGVLFACVTRQPPRQRANGTALRSLTQRERQVVERIGEGFSNKEISSRPHLSVHTVKSHVHGVLEKPRLRSRVQVTAAGRTDLAPARHEELDRTGDSTRFP